MFDQFTDMCPYCSSTRDILKSICDTITDLERIEGNAVILRLDDGATARVAIINIEYLDGWLESTREISKALSEGS